LRFSFNQERAMTKVRREEVYLSPMKAERFTGLSRKTLIEYVQRGLLNHYRTEGRHRRYALSDLKALREALHRRAGK
jgi:predicted site-specific integrase-resolvase